MDTKYRVRFGRLGEDFAIGLLRDMGYVILARNYRCYQGEIDVIARRGQVIHFIEVKTRFGSGNGRPEEAVTDKKQKAMRSAAKYFMSRVGSDEYDVVFDVMAIEVAFIENCL
ncbi:MAG: YraN family protein [Mogibacterium sp.]|nr:YraN family protein [Mogibacterium sp.]